MSTPPPFPAPRDPAVQAALDDSHLRLLQVGFYIMGALTLLRIIWLIFIAFFFALGGFGALAAATHQHGGGQVNNAAGLSVMLIFAAVFGVLGLLAIIFTVLEFLAASALRQRRNMLLIQIVAGLYCISLPWGTALGVCAFMVLNRPSVKALFS